MLAVLLFKIWALFYSYFFNEGHLKACSNEPFVEVTSGPFGRVATHSGKQGKQGKWWKKIPCREKSGNLKFCWKSGKNQGISKNLKVILRSKYSNFIAVQMWLLVVSFCHMLKIPADLILLKGGVLVRWSTCLLYILFFLFLIPKWIFYCKPNVCH